MPRVTGIIDEKTEEAVKAHSEQYGIPVSKLVAMGVPLAMEAHRKTVLAHATTPQPRAKLAR